MSLYWRWFCNTHSVRPACFHLSVLMNAASETLDIATWPALTIQRCSQWLQIHLLFSPPDLTLNASNNLHQSASPILYLKYRGLGDLQLQAFFFNYFSSVSLSQYNTVVFASIHYSTLCISTFVFHRRKQVMHVWNNVNILNIKEMHDFLHF